MASGEDEDIAYFRTILWCAHILDDATFNYASTGSREPKSSSEDAFFAETLKTLDTIPACVSMYRKPTRTNTPIQEVRTLLHLARGLNGYPHIAHGGVQCFLMDESMALLLTYNKDLEGGPIRVSTVTASLKVSFIKPVKTPSVVLVISKLVSIHGRKHYIESEIQDHGGNLLAKAEALFIALSNKNGDAKL
jgi:acyl-coenzyme A thioesterase PaaI-like protein